VHADFVFSGTVLELADAGNYRKTAVMRVTEKFKGQLPETVRLFDDGMCDGPELESGRRYLFYTWGDPSHGLPSRGCSRSRFLEDADEDISYLRKYRDGNVTTAVSGTVLFRPTDTSDSDESRTPMKDVVVRLSGERGDFRAKTSSLGRYEISDLPVGEYEVTAELAGYQMNPPMEPVTVRRNSCATADGLLSVDRRISGRVFDHLGAPAKDVRVELVPTGDLSNAHRWFLSDTSDSGGHYSINAVPSGEYWLGVNISRVPRRDSPYGKRYYPGTADIQEAVRIHVGVGVSARNLDLMVEPPLAVVQMTVRIVDRDGKALEGSRPKIRVGSGERFSRIDVGETEADDKGRIQFEVCDGVRYSIWAFHGRGSDSKYSGQLEFTAAATQEELTLVIDKTLEEFEKLAGRENR